MPTINKKQISFLVVFVLFLTYIVTGLTIFIMNGHSLFTYLKYFSFDFTYVALINNYPNSRIALLYNLSAFSFLALIILFLPRERSLFGNAKFASISDIKNKMKLFGKEGIIIGKVGKKLLKFSGQEFVALGAPTRTGKGVSIVIPNLLEWKQSCVVLDIKQECFDLTSKYRKEILNQEVFIFNPFSHNTHCYNPLSVIDMKNKDTRDNDLLNLISLIYPSSSSSDTEKFFNEQAQNLFKGLCYLYNDLNTLEGKKFLEENNIDIDFSFAGILALSNGFNLEINEDELDEDEELEEEEQKIKGLDETIEYLDYLEILTFKTLELLNDYKDIASVNTKSGVLQTFKAPLMIFRNEPIKSATSKSDFNLSDLRKKRMTIYIAIQPNKLDIARPILNIFFSQLIGLNTEELPSKNDDLKYSCLLLLDEFTSIGFMGILQKSVSFIAGYNLRLLTIFQDISQLENNPNNGYGKEGAKTLLSNHAVKIFFTPSDIDEAKKISERLGDTTVKSKSKTLSDNRGILENSNSSTNSSDTKRALLLPQELIEIEPTKELILMNNQKPIFCDKSFYFNDDYFINKFRKVSKTIRDNPRPKKEHFDYLIKSGETAIKI